MIFLVDFENVHSGGLAGIASLTENDTVYIFYTVNSNSLSFEAHFQMQRSAAEIRYISVSSGGRNALDFQLASFLGYLAASSEDREIKIISGDNGFSFLKHFWEKTMQIPYWVKTMDCGELSVEQAPSIKKAADKAEKPAEEAAAETEAVPEAEIKTAPETAEAEQEPAEAETEPDTVKTVLASVGVVDDDICGTVRSLIMSARDKQHFYTSTTKQFGMETGLVIYKSLRSDYAELKKQYTR